jgi:hypothetical protein
VETVGRIGSERGEIAALVCSDVLVEFPGARAPLVLDFLPAFECVDLTFGQTLVCGERDIGLLRSLDQRALRSRRVTQMRGPERP